MLFKSPVLSHVTGGKDKGIVVSCWSAASSSSSSVAKFLEGRYHAVQRGKGEYDTKDTNGVQRKKKSRAGPGNYVLGKPTHYTHKHRQGAPLCERKVRRTS
jgi:hypothetical protein